MPKDLHELPRLSDSISYIYAEHAIIEQSDSSVVMIQKDGRVPLPIAATTCLLLGPGTSVTHAAIKTINDRDAWLCGAVNGWDGSMPAGWGKREVHRIP